VELDEVVLDQLKRVTPNPPENLEDIFPCSPIQEVFLVAQTIHPELYNCTVVLEIKSAAEETPLDFTRLIDAWNRLVKRHASLRTVFIENTNRPGHFDQAVLKEAIAPLEYLNGDGEEFKAEDLSSRCPVSFENHQQTHRAVICRQSAYSAILRLDITHALVDGISFNILFSDFATGYQNEDSVVTSISYHDFVSYQQHISPKASIDYWSNYLVGAQPSFFPTTTAFLGRHDLRTVRRCVDLDFPMLEHFCEKFSATIANLCQITWALVLRSYTGSDQVSFSYVNSGRQTPLDGIENTVGGFIDTMICRINVSEATTLAQALNKAKDDFIQGSSHPTVFIASHETHGRNFSLLRGNTLMIYQRRISDETIKESGLEFKVLDQINPSEVSEKLVKIRFDMRLMRIN
jgi:hypothetical protein